MSPNILIVDDSPIVRKIIIFSLKKTNYNLISALDGIDALEKFAQTKIDLLITNLNMPKMDGFELIYNIKSDPLYKDTPTVIVTTENEQGFIKRGIDVGANVYLIKPVNPEKLRESVNQLLKGGEKISENISCR
ncbi:MAG: response regulator [bacterium]